MKYLIDRLVVFNTDDGTLHLPSSEDVIRLALPAARLLETFLSSEGRELTREYLLETVWDKHGLHASGNNLNQYISILRRNLSLLGCHELIITLPKLGFRLNAAISIEIVDTGSVSPDPSPSLVTPSGHFQGLFLIGSIIITLLTGLAIGYFYYTGTSNGDTVLHEQYSECDIYYLKHISDDEKKEALNNIMNIMKNNGIQCKKMMCSSITMRRVCLIKLIQERSCRIAMQGKTALLFHVIISTVIDGIKRNEDNMA
ncbi:winged helix-turn-helix domain-containing protein [Enterobacter asburiae]|uniref:winged helix-turn-helix domain-containing protein n=1 Tax=Enterobacter asburiae TaxID=61645 RepID=UPI001CBD8931|nr:winged helix-turn-helix domain-containing protein [Enterobacter asburiae]